jgi:hypothetical protein|tara:strand:- start:145 stop:345 length:201 start_codon:yes stop_codon:yes gene_type:complete
MKSKKKFKEIKLKMEFNPGTQKYEPKLPILKKGIKIKKWFDWQFMVFLILAVILISLSFYIFYLIN